jgi:endonuclease/exonuclease/phosphatase family metal-dependent hydrolase
VAQTPPIALRLLTFNIWRGGIQVDMSRVVEAIRLSGADIVGLQEPEGRTCALAEALGWPFADPTHHLLSRCPIFAPTDMPAHYALAEVQPGRFIAIANLHLNSDPSGTAAVRDGATAAEVIALERAARLGQVAPVLATLKRLAGEGLPAFLLGDFNAPSHLDWTAETVNARPQIRYPLDWPVSRAIAEAGFADSYRAVHHDPLVRPGITWTPGYPCPRVKPDECLDRIDFIYAAGPAAATDSRLIGEAGGPEVEIAVTPWPSDHRAVLSTFHLQPGTRPAMIAVDRRAVAAGSAFSVRIHAADAVATRIVVAAMEDDPVAAPIMSMPVADETDRRVVAFGTGLLQPGSYRIVLISAADRILAATAIRVFARGEAPALRATAVAGSIRIAWRAAPGNRFDWIAVYPAGTADLQGFILYRYTDARIDGEMLLTPDAPLPTGTYEVRLMADDAHIVLASTTIRVPASIPHS